MAEKYIFQLFKSQNFLKISWDKDVGAYKKATLKELFTNYSCRKTGEYP